MVPAGGHHRPDRPPVIYVTRFASHRPGVWPLRGPRGLRLQGPELGACLAVERAAVESGPPGAALSSGSRARLAATLDSTSFQLRRSRASRAPRGLEQAARAGLNQKNAAKAFDFPIPLNEASKIMKERKKAAKSRRTHLSIAGRELKKTEKEEVLVWKKVHKVISRMIAENEKYRHRLKCQNLSSELQLNHFMRFQQPWNVVVCSSSD